MVVVQSRHIPNGFVYVCIGSTQRAPGFQWQNKGLVRDSRNLIKHVSCHPGSFCFLDGGYRSKILIFHVNLSTRVSMGASNYIVVSWLKTYLLDLQPTYIIHL